jgi:hypothetical protein
VEQLLWLLVAVAEAAVQKAAAEMVSAAVEDKTVALVQTKVAVEQLVVKVVRTVKAHKALVVLVTSLVLVVVAEDSVAVTEETFLNKTAFLVVAEAAVLALSQLAVQL